MIFYCCKSNIMRYYMEPNIVSRFYLLQQQSTKKFLTTILQNADRYVKACA